MLTDFLLKISLLTKLVSFQVIIVRVGYVRAAGKYGTNMHIYVAFAMGESSGLSCFLCDGNYRQIPSYTGNASQLNIGFLKCREVNDVAIVLIFFDFHGMVSLCL